jgi:hypothetical protein
MNESQSRLPNSSQYRLLAIREALAVAIREAPHNSPFLP